jgi:glutamate formiminotransferase
MARVLEMVPNFSEGRDLDVVHALRTSMESAGVRVVDWSADPDHHRCVITAFGEPAAVERAALAAARVARDRIDLSRHAGAHPRSGALDVLPFVPLAGATMDDARAVARRVGERLAAELDLPVYFYAEASEPRGRGLAELRRGGYEALLDGWPAGRQPDCLPPGWPYPGAHPTAGVTCVGARGVLLAWNVQLEGVTLAAARDIARRIRETGGGFSGLRALALVLPGRPIQISMNLENTGTTYAADVLDRIDALAVRAGGRVLDTEIIGLLPDDVAAAVANQRLRSRVPLESRLLSRRLAEHLAECLPQQEVETAAQ